MSSNPGTPIADYGLIGDTRTGALVGSDGSIDWMCLPRFDSPPVFARLVGGRRSGHFLIGPGESAIPSDRHYSRDTATLVTTWSVDGGRLALADSMIADITGRMLPTTTLVRRVSAEGRPIPVRVEFAPRFGYSRDPAGGMRRHHGAVVVERSGLVIGLTSTSPALLSPDTTLSIEVEPEKPLVVVMVANHRTPLFIVPPNVAVREAERDEARWRRWSDTLTTGPDHRQLLVRSLITLQLLTYSPSGAPVAAPTTSLPEAVGGSRNWDYRYAWPRDASLGIAAFLEAGKNREALRFLAWLLHASRLDRPRLPALFTLDGRPAPRERELGDWPGYSGSTPVRIGNGARTQHQLDGYGWVLDAAWHLTRRGHSLDSETWRTMRAFAESVSRRWTEPDAGIWERRDHPRQHVHSKFMAWVALDRALRIGAQRGWNTRQLSAFRAARKLLGQEVLDRGFNREIGSYVAVYGSEDVDASLLLLPSVGLEATDSPRLTGTIDAVRSRLGAGGPLLYRYQDRDGLPDSEGAFLACSFWLVSALAQLGRRAEAETLFGDLLEYGSPLGLYGEEIDPTSREHLGNFPQALTHSALLQAASSLVE